MVVNGDAYKPDYRITANDTDITGIVRERLISVRWTDAVGMKSDVLEITLADDDEDAPIAIPPTGAEISFAIGYDGDVRKVGLFVCDEVEVSGWPGQMVIRANAATFEKSKTGKSDLQSQKSRSWEAGTTLGDMVKTIGKEHGLAPVITPELAAIKLPHIDQTDESDINLLLRMARRYDAAIKPAGGKLVVTKEGESKTASGKPMPTATVYRNELLPGWRMLQSKRESAGQAVAYYHAIDEAKRHEVSVGKGEPVRRIKQPYPTEEMALAAARADLSRRSRGKATFSYQTYGRHDIVAEGKSNMVDMRPGVAGEWLNKRVEHSLDVGGWLVRVECETGNSGEEEDVSVETTEPDAVGDDEKAA